MAFCKISCSSPPLSSIFFSSSFIFVLMKSIFLFDSDILFLYSDFTFSIFSSLELSLLRLSINLVCLRFNSVDLADFNSEL